MLTHFQNLTHEEVTEQCVNLSTTLHFKGQSDLDGRELAQELNNLPHLPSKTISLLELLTFIHENELLLN